MLNGTRRSGWLKPLCVFVIAGPAYRLSARDLAAQSNSMDTVAIREHTRVLSHDSLEGRGTGSRGAAVAARYIAGQCRAIGLSPLADDYLLPVSLIESEIDPAASWLEFRSDDGGPPIRLRTPDDFVPGRGRYADRTEFRGINVFIGPADSVGNDTPAPASPAIAVSLGVPRSSDVHHLESRGYRAAIHVAPNAQVYRQLARRWGRFRWAHANPRVVSSQLTPIPTLILSPQATTGLMRGAVRRNGAVETLRGETTAHIAARVRELTVHNVGCVHRSTRTHAGVIAFSAHLDHLGVSIPDASGDSVYNGFSDNAAGVAMLLAIGAAVAGETWEHDVAFLFFNAEEQGLLGSDAFVHDSPLPLARIRAVINLDAGAPPGPPTTWRIAGGDSELRRLAVREAETRGWRAGMSPATPNTDYFPFHRMGVPAVFVVPGPGPYEGMTESASDQLKSRWDAYHQAHDHWHADFPFSGLARYAEYALAIARAADTALARR